METLCLTLRLNRAGVLPQDGILVSRFYSHVISQQTQNHKIMTENILLYAALPPKIYQAFDSSLGILGQENWRSVRNVRGAANTVKDQTFLYMSRPPYLGGLQMYFVLFCFLKSFVFAEILLLLPELL